MIHFITIEATIFNHAFFFIEFGFDERVDRAIAEINSRVDVLETDPEAEMLEARELFRNLVSMVVSSDALGLINAVLYRVDLISISSTVRHLFVVFFILFVNSYKSFALSQFINKCFCKIENSL